MGEFKQVVFPQGQSLPHYQLRVVSYIKEDLQPVFFSWGKDCLWPSKINSTVLTRDFSLIITGSNTYSFLSCRSLRCTRKENKLNSNSSWIPDQIVTSLLTSMSRLTLSDTDILPMNWLNVALISSCYWLNYFYYSFVYIKCEAWR